MSYCIFRVAAQDGRDGQEQPGTPGGGTSRHCKAGRSAAVSNKPQLQPRSLSVMPVEFRLTISPQTADDSNVRVCPLAIFLGSPFYRGVSAELKVKVKKRSRN